MMGPMIMSAMAHLGGLIRHSEIRGAPATNG